MAESADATAGIRASRALRVGILVKQVPAAESLTLRPDGRLEREGLVLEMNPYCRRAVAKGVAIAQASGGSATVITMGPPAAQDVLREAIAWGATRGVHLCDVGFSGADTLATSRALVGAIRREGPFDLVLVGRNSTDGETGQVGPQVAELLDLGFASGVRHFELDGDELLLQLEHDDGSEEVALTLPALFSVAERLCDPCKVDPAGRAAVAPTKITTLGVSDLESAPYGVGGSPTWVGEVRSQQHSRRPQILSGPLESQAKEAVALLIARGALGDGAKDASTTDVRDFDPSPRSHEDAEREIVVVIEPERDGLSAELLGAARALSAGKPARVVAFRPHRNSAMDPIHLGALGATAVIDLQSNVGQGSAEDVGHALGVYIKESAPWVVLAPSTAFGREVAGRAAAATTSGLIGDAVSVSVVDGAVIAAKPAFAGSLVADVGASSQTTLVTIRPGVLSPAIPESFPKLPTISKRPLGHRGRVRSLRTMRDDDVELLARAQAVVGVGAGVAPTDYAHLDQLRGILGAEMAATRKVTDKGYIPRARQLGITGRAISPRLYFAIGLSGKFNHMVGVRAAQTVVAINNDENALVFGQCDIGIVGEWHEAVDALVAALTEAGYAPA